MKLNKIAQCIAMMGIAGYAFGQTVPEQKLQRVEITGSSIKRINAEGSLPIQVITADEMTKKGIASVEQLLSQITANASGADNAVSNNNNLYLANFVESATYMSVRAPTSVPAPACAATSAGCSSAPAPTCRTAA